MLDVFFTTDVETWFHGMPIARENFGKAFDISIRGRTPKGDFGLAYQVNTLRDHGLTGVFFVEPLFSTCFGHEALAEIVGEVSIGAQEVQLHLHTEWVDRSGSFEFKNARHRENLHEFELEEQTTLIGAGIRLLQKAGARDINAFRAGNYGLNLDTLRALAANGIAFDSSYNATRFGLESNVLPGQLVVEPILCEGVFEYPVAVFKDGTGALRHVQLSACSLAELERLLWQALDRSRTAFVIVSHSFELLNRNRNGPDSTAIKRFERLCRLLADNRNCFRVRGFRGLQPDCTGRQPTPLQSRLMDTGRRMVEQAFRRIFA